MDASRRMVDGHAAVRDDVFPDRGFTERGKRRRSAAPENTAAEQPRTTAHERSLVPPITEHQERPKIRCPVCRSEKVRNNGQHADGYTYFRCTVCVSTGGQDAGSWTTFKVMLTDPHGPDSAQAERPPQAGGA